MKKTILIKNIFLYNCRYLSLCVKDPEYDEHGFEVEVMSLKSVNKENTDFKKNPKDISYINQNQIIKVFSEKPKIKFKNDTQLYFFENKIDVNEM